MPHGRERLRDRGVEETTPLGQKCEQNFSGAVCFQGTSIIRAIGAANVCSEAQYGGWDCVVKGLYIYK